MKLENMHNFNYALEHLIDKFIMLLDAELNGNSFDAFTSMASSQKVYVNFFHLKLLSFQLLTLWWWIRLQKLWHYRKRLFCTWKSRSRITCDFKPDEEIYWWEDNPNENTTGSHHIDILGYKLSRTIELRFLFVVDNNFSQK